MNAPLQFIRQRSIDAPLAFDARQAFIQTNVEYIGDLTSYWTAVAQLEEAVGAELRQ